MMKWLRNISRILVGLVFIFSGFVKGIDPWGGTYKITDYFYAFHLDFLVPIALPLSFILSFAEFAIGVGLLSGTFLRFFSWMALIFMSFFTPLTLYLALNNPVTDCGCFGDALVITNWQTFYKNIVLILLAIILFIGRKKSDHPFKRTFGKFLFSGFVLTYIILVTWSYNHLPLIDFRPYKVGVNIAKAMEIPPDAQADVYENNFYYKNKKTGEVKKFSEANIPWRDSLTWEFQAMDQPILVKKGYVPPIHDFSIQTPQGDDVTDYFLDDNKFTFMLIAYDLQRSSVKNQERINELSRWAEAQGYNFICLTASLEDEQQTFIGENNAPYPFLSTDEITLKTMIRSNPGLILTYKGTILAKWHNNDIPDSSTFRDEILPEMNKKLNRD